MERERPAARDRPAQPRTENRQNNNINRNTSNSSKSDATRSNQALASLPLVPTQDLYPSLDPSRVASDRLSALHRAQVNEIDRGNSVAPNISDMTHLNGILAPSIAEQRPLYPQLSSDLVADDSAAPPQPPPFYVRHSF